MTSLLDLLQVKKSLFQIVFLILPSIKIVFFTLSLVSDKIYLFNFIDKFVERKYFLKQVPNKLKLAGREGGATK